MPEFSISVYPHLRNHALLVAGGRRLDLPVRPERIAELLGEDPLAAADPAYAAVPEVTRLVRRLKRLSAMRAEPSRASAWLVVDGGISAAVDETLLRDLCAPVAVAGVVQEGAAGVERVRDASVLITLADAFDYAKLTQWEDLAAERGLRWCAFCLTDTGGGYGPFVDPGRTPGIRDLASRWISAARHESHTRAMLARPAVAVRADLSRGALLWVLATFFADVHAWLAGRPARGSWHRVTLDASQLAMRADPVLPRPDRHVEFGGSAVAGISARDVLNPVTGIVVGVRPIRFRSPIPRGVTYLESQTADMSRLLPWASNIYNAGSSWDSTEEAERGAIGEAIERYCGNVVNDSRLIRASCREMLHRGDRVVDPRELVLFSEKQYASPGFPFVEFDEELRVSWVPGESLVTGERVWVPASLVYVNWNSGVSSYDPPTNPAFYPGIAAGTSLDYAICNALEEVVERDAATLWWLSGYRLPTTDGPPNGFVRDRSPAGSPLVTTLVPIPNRCGFPVLAGVVTDTRTGMCTLGLASRATPEAAAKKALLEAFGLFESALDMQDPRGGFWQAHERAGTAQAIKPVREDRAYLDAYRADFRDVTDLFCQLQIQLDPRSGPVVRTRWGDRPEAPWELLPALPERSRQVYVDRLSRIGLEPIWVDLTTVDARAAGWHAVRVVVPGLAPNFPTAFPPLGAGRVATEPVRLGWLSQPLDDESVWRFPIPYA
jgi:ribosomal protein S12 methylthiotransferase accessory factor